VSNPRIKLAVLDTGGTTEEAIRALRDAGIAVCLASGYSQRTLDRIVDAMRWQRLIDGALAPGPGRRGRPHPDLVLSAVLTLGIAGVLTGAHAYDDLSRAPHTHLVEGVWDLPDLLVPGYAPLSAV
jgi:phosphoglycolate phosphatase-like HAD superfamily hydrolase